MGHVNHPQQAVGDRQPQRGQQQHRSQRQPHKGLAQQIAEQQTMFDLLQAIAGRLAHRRIRLMLGIGKGDQQRLGFRVRGMAEQRHGGQPRAGLRLSELQARQRHLQQTPHIIIGFRLQPLLQQRGHGRGRFPL